MEFAVENFWGLVLQKTVRKGTRRILVGGGRGDFLTARRAVLGMALLLGHSEATSFTKRILAVSDVKFFHSCFSLATFARREMYLGKCC